MIMTDKDAKDFYDQIEAMKKGTKKTPMRGGGMAKK